MLLWQIIRVELMKWQRHGFSLELKYLLDYFLPCNEEIQGQGSHMWGGLWGVVGLRALFLWADSQNMGLFIFLFPTLVLCGNWECHGQKLHMSCGLVEERPWVPTLLGRLHLFITVSCISTFNPWMKNLDLTNTSTYLYLVITINDLDLNP